MAKKKLTNYIRIHRRRAGLTQRELASLLGLRVRGPISEIENRRRVPLLRTALALSAIFGVPVEELFPGMQEAAASEVRRRREKLASALASKVGPKERSGYRTARKLEWLTSRSGSGPANALSSQTSPRR